MSRHDVVIEKSIGKYLLPDNAIDLEEWLRDGLEVYNLFVLMKPAFFQMLEQLGGEFRASSAKANKDRRAYRLSMRTETVGEAGDPDYDLITVATLTAAPSKKRAATRKEPDLPR